MMSVALPVSENNSGYLKHWAVVVIQDRWFWYQSKALIWLPISP